MASGSRMRLCVPPVMYCRATSLDLHPLAHCPYMLCASEQEVCVRVWVCTRALSLYEVCVCVCVYVCVCELRRLRHAHARKQLVRMESVRTGVWRACAHERPCGSVGECACGLNLYSLAHGARMLRRMWCESGDCVGCVCALARKCRGEQPWYVQPNVGKGGGGGAGAGTG